MPERFIRCFSDEMALELGLQYVEKMSKDFREGWSHSSYRCVEDFGGMKLEY